MLLQEGRALPAAAGTACRSWDPDRTHGGSQVVREQCAPRVTYAGMNASASRYLVIPCVPLLTMIASGQKS